MPPGFSPFKAPNAIGRRGGLRNSKGQFISDEVSDAVLSTQYGEALGEAYKKKVAERVQEALRGSVWSTGTLVRAILAGTVQTRRETTGDNKGRLYVTIAIPDMTRTREPRFRGDTHTQENVQNYYFYYFGGRKAFTTQKAMIFKGRDSRLVVTRSVKASASHEELLKMSDADWKQILAEPSVQEAYKSGLHSR